MRRERNADMWRVLGQSILCVWLGWVGLGGHGGLVQAQNCAGMELQEASAVAPSQADSDPQPSWSVTQANAFVRSVFRSENVEARPSAADVYLRLLTVPFDTLSDEERAIVGCHRRQLRLILPDTLRQRIARPAGEDPQLQENLLLWWRAQDPLPATERNERLEEHLRRVAYAARHYGDTDASTGVDARGEVYIRLGPPARSTSVRFNASRVLTLIRESPVLTRGDFPDNEYWVYPQVDQHAKYLFVEKDGSWEIGAPHDLIPSFFRAGLGSNARGQDRVLDLGVLFEEVFSQLGTIDVDYGPWYQEAESATAFTVSGTRPDPSQMRQMITESREFEAQRAFEREQTVPQQFSEVPEADEALPVNVRIARFLDDDGSTRTEVYWIPEPGSFRVADRGDRYPAYDEWDSQLLLFAAVQQESDFERRAIHYKRYMVREHERTEGTIEPQSYAVTGDTGTYHLRLQWQQHIARGSTHSSVEVGPRVKVQAVRFDSLQALRAQPDRLEMSDLKPLQPSSPDTLQDEQPYPFDYWDAQAPLVLYFEIYNLVLGADDQTRYTVEYAIERRTERGGIRGWLGGTEDRRTTTETTYTGSTRTESEHILLSLDEEVIGKSGAVRITVRVTDEHTGQDIERAIAFQLPSSSGSAE